MTWTIWGVLKKNSGCGECVKIGGWRPLAPILQGLDQKGSETGWGGVGGRLDKAMPGLMGRGEILGFCERERTGGGGQTVTAGLQAGLEVGKGRFLKCPGLEGIPGCGGPWVGAR